MKHQNPAGEAVPEVPTINDLKNESDFEKNSNREKFTVRSKTRFYEVVKTDKGYIIFSPPDRAMILILKKQ